ncbi:MAG: hypothetical protein ACK5F7_20615 [Planctomycetaceae bacterium]
MSPPCWVESAACRFVFVRGVVIHESVHHKFGAVQAEADGFEKSKELCQLDGASSMG